MKILFLFLILTPLIAFSGVTTPTTEPSPGVTLTEIESIGQVILAAHAVSVALYPSWDPYITVGGVKHPYGFGGAILYPVSQYAFAGIRVDFLGKTFWAPSAVVGAKYTLANLPLSPTVFTIGGLMVPVAGATGDTGGNASNGKAEATTGVGITFVLLHNKANTGSLNGFLEGEKITDFAGINTHLGLAGGISF